MTTGEHLTMSRTRGLARTRSTTRTRSRGVVAVLFGVLLLLGLGSAGAGAAGGGDAGGGPVTQQKQIASASLASDYKFTLTAVRSTQDEYAAPVRLVVFTRSDAGLRVESDRVTVGEADGWFWYPLTGRGAVCEFSTASTEAAPVTVRLLLTPSLGCSEPLRFVVKEGTVHPAE